MLEASNVSVMAGVVVCCHMLKAKARCCLAAALEGEAHARILYGVASQIV